MGYSQGGMVLHNALSDQGINGATTITSAVLFGDPFLKKPVGNLAAGQVLQICHKGDLICEAFPSIIVTPAHLTYTNDAPAAATFIAKTAGR